VIGESFRSAPISIIPAVKRRSQYAELFQRASSRKGDCSTSRMIAVLADAEYFMRRLPHPPIMLF
jgi:hypothetical protein